ncbi:MAG: helix-turn-helix transcriptional regulator [Lachnospiraceae bacterium]|nr:helix-turn-helix transcriptional regulator [Lachnospiraceae bacterium]
MNTLNERIKKVRKDLGLSQKEFAAKIGISQRAVSWGEQPGNNVPDNTIKALCMIFKVNEPWIRYGTEPMYIESSTFSLDIFLETQQATPLEIDILKAYFELEPDIRKMLLEHFQKHISVPHPDSVSAVEAAEAAYIKSRSNSVQKKTLSASNTTTEEDPINERNKNVQ